MRFNEPLSLDAIRAIAPSVFALEAHESRSSRYVYVPTIEPLKALMNEGFFPFDVKQSRSRVPGKADFTKHMLRLRHRKAMEQATTSREYSEEVIIVNSHDGTSAAHLRGGVYRFACCNGLVVPENESLNLKVYHKGNVEEVNNAFIEAAYEVTGIFDKVKEDIEVMKSVTLPMDVKLATAEAALALKYGDEEPILTPQQILRPSPRNGEHEGGQAWNVFNIMQRNIVKGGIKPHQRNRRRTRPIEGIDQNLKVNEALWRLAETVARQLAA